MASGHVSRIKRPNTWLHRPMLQNVKKALANTEPSTHWGTSACGLIWGSTAHFGFPTLNLYSSDRENLAAREGRLAGARRPLAISATLRNAPLVTNECLLQWRLPWLPQQRLSRPRSAPQSIWCGRPPGSPLDGAISKPTRSATPSS
jgi:hypothetical protein